jgi:hypothetical protein
MITETLPASEYAATIRELHSEWPVLSASFPFFGRRRMQLTDEHLRTASTDGLHECVYGIPGVPKNVMRLPDNIFSILPVILGVPGSFSDMRAIIWCISGSFLGRFRKKKRYFEK